MTSPREEAERLIATVLGGASVAAEGLRGFATGSAECCVCPICKAIAAARDPSPELAERLAGGAGELASGLAGVLRAFAGAAGSMASSTATATAAAAGAAAGGGGNAADDPWRAATRGEEPAPQPPTAAAPSADPARPMAKKATKPKNAAPPSDTGTDPANGSDGAAPAQEER